MKKVAALISYISAGLLIFLSLIFIVIEGRTLFSLDWSVFENSVNGFFRYLFRLLIALFTFVLGIFTYFAISKKANKIMHIYFYIGSITIFVVSLVIAIEMVNYIGYIFVVISIIYLIGSYLHFYLNYLKRI